MQTPYEASEHMEREREREEREEEEEERYEGMLPDNSFSSKLSV